MCSIKFGDVERLIVFKYLFKKKILAQTFHSFIGGIFNGNIEDEIKKALSKPFLVQRLREADIVILDECGMMSCDFYDKGTGKNIK